MTYETLRNIHIGSAALAALTLLVCAFLFIRFNIPRAIRGLTGVAEKRPAAGRKPRSGPEKSPPRRADRPPEREPSPATTPLPEDAAPPDAAAAFEVEYDITYIHTDESI
ncbi:MAG: hypothetical protein LBK23_00205 [Oscillospiraceae bacterium]|jgi:hypothetical protein|nr:hypothetical protein [Oscillospiraceae bacterium]